MCGESLFDIYSDIQVPGILMIHAGQVEDWREPWNQIMAVSRDWLGFNLTRTGLLLAQGGGDRILVDGNQTWS